MDKTISKTLSIFIIFLVITSVLVVITDNSKAGQVDYVPEELQENYRTSEVGLFDFEDMNITHEEREPWGYWYANVDDPAIVENSTSDVISKDQSFKYKLDAESTESNTDAFGYSTSTSDLENFTHLPYYSVKSISFWIKYRCSSSQDSDFFQLLQQYTFQDRSFSKEYSNSSDFETDEWYKVSVPIDSIGWERAGFSLMVTADYDFGGTLEVWVDNVKVNYRVSEVSPFLYNQFTGVGINRESFKLQYKDLEGNWQNLGYDPKVYWIAGLNLEMRALDYWNQEIWKDNITPRKSEEIVEIPIPILKLKIKHNSDCQEPKFTISTGVSENKRVTDGWSIEIIAGRTYQFAWDNFYYFLNGTQNIDLSFTNTGSVYQSFYGSSDSNEGSNDPIKDDNVKYQGSGRAIADLNFHINPDYYKNAPPLDWGDGSKLGTNILAGFAYEFFGVEYTDWMVYKDPIWPDWIYAVYETKTGKATAFLIAILGFSLTMWRLYMYFEQNRRIEDVERRQGVNRR